MLAFVGKQTRFPEYDEDGDGKSGQNGGDLGGEIYRPDVELNVGQG